MNIDRVKNGLGVLRSKDTTGRHCRSLITSVALGLILFLIAGCGGSSSGGGSPSAEEVEDIAGVWSVNEVVDETGCEGGITIDEYSVTIEQEGNQITVIAPDDTFYGSINGNNISWTGSFQVDEGTTTITSMSLTLSSDGASLNGTCTWTWSDGDYTCYGTTEITATRIITSTLEVSGTWEGNWQSTINDVNGTFTAVVVQQDSVLSGSIAIPFIGMDEDLEGSVTGDTMVFGDIYGEITFTGNVSGDYASGSYYYPSMNDYGVWEATR